MTGMRLRTLLSFRLLLLDDITLHLEMEENHLHEPRQVFEDVGRFVEQKDGSAETYELKIRTNHEWYEGDHQPTSRFSNQGDIYNE